MKTCTNICPRLHVVSKDGYQCVNAKNVGGAAQEDGT